MHYKNGREAVNGDKILSMPQIGSPAVGILYEAAPGNDYCNGKIAAMLPNDRIANLSECLHYDDVVAATASAEEEEAHA